MTATVFVPAGNPVRRFVLALAAVGVAGSALWFSGVAAPRLAIVSAEPEPTAAAARGTLRFQLRNDGPLAVEVRSIRFRDERIGTGPARPLGVDLSGGEAATFQLDYTIDCAGSTEPAQARLMVTVATPLGIERIRDVGDTGILDGACLSR